MLREVEDAGSMGVIIVYDVIALIYRETRGGVQRGPHARPPPSASIVAPDYLKGGFSYLRAKIGGFDYHVLVDTGASRSVICKQLWLSVAKGGCDDGRATAANGGECRFWGAGRLYASLIPLHL